MSEVEDLSPVALRLRRHRERQRRGEVVLRVPVKEALFVGWLIDKGRITEDESADLAVVAEATARLLREICR